jgi:hypothetical protein
MLKATVIDLVVCFAEITNMSGLQAEDQLRRRGTEELSAVFMT